MGKLGSGNPLPFEIGGGPSTVEKYYDALKQAVGKGNSGEDGSLEAEWRLARAKGIRAAFADERAVMQWFPDRCTDFIEVWEDLLKLTVGPGLEDQERRDNITERLTSAQSAITSVMERALQNIDPLFSVIGIEPSISITTVLGRGFQDTNPSAAQSCGPAFYGGRKSTQYPNYSSDFICYVLYDIGGGAPSAEQERIVVKAEQLLYDILPSWMDFNISFSAVGFILDQDLLDVGCFT